MSWRRSKLFGQQNYDPTVSGPQPIFNAPGLVLLAILVLILAHLGLSLASPEVYEAAILNLAVIPLRYLSLLDPAQAAGVWAETPFADEPMPPPLTASDAPGLIAPLFGHMLVHGGLLHLGFNCIWLLIFGAANARRLQRGGDLWGGCLWIALFALGGACGAITHIALHLESFIPLVGASGGVSAMMGAAVRFALRRPSVFDEKYPPLMGLGSRPVVAFSAVWLFANVVFGLAPLTQLAEGASIAWEAHIGGYVFGLLSISLFDRLAGPLERQGRLDQSW